MNGTEIGTWISIVIGLLVIVKVVRDLGKLEGIVVTKLTHIAETDVKLWEKLDALSDSGLLTTSDHRELCTDVTLNFNRQITELVATSKEDAKERARSNRILTRLEALYGERRLHDELEKK